MENYEDLLRRKYLLGTPKEQFEWVENLVKENSNLKAKITYANLSLQGILDTTNDAKLGDMKFMLQLIKNQIEI